MNVLYGLLNADEGEIFINGKQVDIKNPNVAIDWDGPTLHVNR